MYSAMMRHNHGTHGWLLQVSDLEACIVNDCNIDGVSSSMHDNALQSREGKLSSATARRSISGWGWWVHPGVAELIMVVPSELSVAHKPEQKINGVSTMMVSMLLQCRNSQFDVQRLRICASHPQLQPNIKQFVSSSLLPKSITGSENFHVNSSYLCSVSQTPCGGEDNGLLYGNASC
jgi:hypothetical protein